MPSNSAQIFLHMKTSAAKPIMEQRILYFLHSRIVTNMSVGSHVVKLPIMISTSRLEWPFMCL